MTEKTLDNFLKPYCSDAILRKRYAAMLRERALRFYLERNFDSAVAEEDLYNGEDFDCSCTQEDADNNRHNEKCEFVKHPYQNLTYSEELEKACWNDLDKINSS